MKIDSNIDLSRVLLDLRQKRLQLDEAIKALEELLGQSRSLPSAAAGKPLFEILDQSHEAELPEQHRVGRVGRFDGLSILTATRDVLAEAREPRTATEIAQLLVSGGYQAKSRNFPNTVAAVLNRCDKTGGDIIRVGKNLFTLVERNQALPASYRSNPNE